MKTKLILLSTLLLIDNFSYAQSKNAASSSDGMKAEHVDVQKVKERYWTKGEESELRVVQNRTYSKDRKIGLGFFYAFISSDPFLSIKGAGATIGYHFHEFLGFNIIGWKNFVSPSSALNTLRSQLGVTANNNHPDYFLGGEVSFSPVYGKLSVLGQSIVYYDLHLLAGGGVMKTESGTYPAPLVGIGQQIYLSKNITLSMDYRLLYYKETLVQKADPSKMGTTAGKRDNYSNCVYVGLTFFGPQL